MKSAAQQLEEIARDEITFEGKTTSLAELSSFFEREVRIFLAQTDEERDHDCLIRRVPDENFIFITVWNSVQRDKLQARKDGIGENPRLALQYSMMEDLIIDTIGRITILSRVIHGQYLHRFNFNDS